MISGRRGKIFRRVAAIGVLCSALLLFTAAANAQPPHWTTVANLPPFTASTALLLTDGTLMVQQVTTGNWWRFTPDITGSYINGSWTQLASMPAGYAPLDYASAVLPDGRMIVEGGEYNPGTTFAETPLGAIYDPVANAWTSVAPPPGWTAIGDAQSVVLPDGTFMLGNCGFPSSICQNGARQQALLDASNLTWTIVGNGKADQNSEEGWTLLPSGDVLTVDVWNVPQSEVFDPSTLTWSLAGSTVAPVVNPCGEIGPAVLRPDGTVFAEGATGSNAIYNSATGTWSAGPNTPNGFGAADGPAALLPNGNVLVDVGSVNPCNSTGSQFYEFDGTNFTQTLGPSGFLSSRSGEGRMLVLPTGQIFFTGYGDAEIYTTVGTYSPAWQPTIGTYPSTVTAGTGGYAISGTQFNGLSQGAMYGDDVQAATNYPLVRITNSSTGHVFYARTHNHSTMAVATGSATVSTEFDVPANVEGGASALEVVANGIPSNPVAINVVAKSSTLIQINAGGPAVSGFMADEDFSGGTTINHTNTIDTTKVTNPAPAAVYDTARIGDFTYTVGGLTAGANYVVRLHFCETFFTAAGDRTFDVSINGTQVLTNFDIFKTAGGQNIANIQEFTAPANANGQFVIKFASVVNHSLVSGIEVETALPPSVQIDSGSATAVAPFGADEDFGGGETIVHANTIHTSNVTNPAPAAVYQTARVPTAAGSGTAFSYTIPGFTPGSNHAVRLHFCETFWTAAGDRKFNVSINGTQVLTDFDIFKTAGGQNIANIQEFLVPANGIGQYFIFFSSVVDKAMVSGIEIE